jgi:hypothetical protein
VDALDRKLLRANELYFATYAESDAADAELADLLPDLVRAGYVEESGHSPTGFFWSFTSTGVAHSKELGAFDESGDD